VVSVLLLGVLLAAVVAGLVACGSQTDSADSTTSSGDAKSVASGDIAGQVGTAIAAAEARVTVSLLEQAFQPTVPVQRLSQDTPILPARGMSLYQAYVTVENRGDKPIRVDPNDFKCQVDGELVAIEPTRSGPEARSLIKNTSLDLILTFIGRSGKQPVLVYMPSWYDGTITISPAAQPTTTGT
jgi:hypothetical protein